MKMTSFFKKKTFLGPILRFEALFIGYSKKSLVQVSLGNTVGKKPDFEANLGALTFSTQNLHIRLCLP